MYDIGIRKLSTTANQIAEVELIGVTEIRRILAGQGKPPLSAAAIAIFVGDGMPKAARGMYDKHACTHWYIGRLRSSLLEKTSADDDGKVVSLSLEQKRLMKARADNEEMTAAERRGVLVPTWMALHHKAIHMKVIANKVRTLPRRIGSLADLQNHEMKAKMMAAVKSLLFDLAKTGPEEFEALLAQWPHPAPPVSKRVNKCYSLKKTKR